MKNDITCDVLTVVFANEGQLLHFKIILEFNHKTIYEINYVKYWKRKNVEAFEHKFAGAVIRGLGSHPFDNQSPAYITRENRRSSYDIFIEMSSQGKNK